MAFFPFPFPTTNLIGPLPSRQLNPPFGTVVCADSTSELIPCFISVSEISLGAGCLFLSQGGMRGNAFQSSTRVSLFLLFITTTEPFSLSFFTCWETDPALVFSLFSRFFFENPNVTTFLSLFSKNAILSPSQNP